MCNDGYRGSSSSTGLLMMVSLHSINMDHAHRPTEPSQLFQLPILHTVGPSSNARSSCRYARPTSRTAQPQGPASRVTQANPYKLREARASRSAAEPHITAEQMNAPKRSPQTGRRRSWLGPAATAGGSPGRRKPQITMLGLCSW